MEFPDYPGIARRYAEMVVSGEIPACQYLQQACQRYLDMLVEAAKPDARFYFSEAWPCDFLSFFEKLRLPSGGKAGDTFVGQPWQIWIACALFGFRRNDPDSPNEIGARLVREVYVEVPRGSGKALALDTPIPTPSGWTTMGAISVGDEIFAKDGTVTKVLAATGVMRNHACYRVTFSNGESVVADENHLWLTTARVNNPGVRVGRDMRRFSKPSIAARTVGNHKYWYAKFWQKPAMSMGRVGVDDAAVMERFAALSAEDMDAFPIGNDNMTRVRTTREIAESLTYGSRGDWNHSVDMPDPLAGQALAPLDPYLFGAWIGDGDSDGARITCSAEDAVHWINEIKLAGFVPSVGAGYTAKRIGICKGFRQALRDIGALHNKHIPQAFLRATVEDRIALLQGLMDTDGHCSADGHSQEFANCNKGVIDGVSELLASLGVRHSVTSKHARLNGRCVGIVYTVRFCVHAERLQPFRMARKAERVRSGGVVKAWRDNTVQIVGCERVESAPVRCISIEHPSKLFLFGKTMLPTHNSPMGAAIALYCWLHEGENGSQVFIGAPKEDQARYVFDPMTAMVENTPGLVEAYNLVVTKSQIQRESDSMAKVRMISSIAQREDGANPHVVVMEELHAQDEALFNVMDSSLGKRVNNLFISITTAGNRAQGVCWNTRRRLIDVLSGTKKEPSFFGVIYTLDKEEAEDKRVAHDPERWIKANPMWGITLSKTSLLERLAKAKSQSAAAVLEFERTRLNIWSDGAGSLISSDNWKACEVPGLDVMALRGRTAWIGADLGSKLDISSLAIIIDDPENDDAVDTHFEHFVPSRCSTFKHDEFGPLYDSWVKSGFLDVTFGTVTDYRRIEERIRFWCTVFQVEAIVFDNYQSNNIVASLFDDGFPAMQMQPGVKTVSDPFKDIQAKIEGGLLRHDGNPVTGWMAANTTGYFDKRGNVLPQKESPNSPYKIDGISALVAANVARADKMLEVKQKARSVYEKRGLHGAS